MIIFHKMGFIKAILYPVQLIYKVYFILLFCISLLLLYPIFYLLLKKLKKFKFSFHLIRAYAKFLLFFAFIKLKIHRANSEEVKNPFIICPNHTSFIDILCVYAAFDNYFVFTGKQEIENWPLFHIFYTSGMNILVDRYSRTGAFKAFKRMGQEIDQGNSIAIFPEGTISKKAPELGNFKSGAFSIALQKKIPIIPVTFLDNWKRFQRGNIFTTNASPGIANMVIHSAIYTNHISIEEQNKLPELIKEIITKPLKKISYDGNHSY